MAYSGPFYYFDQVVQTPFTDGVAGTVNAAMSAVQGPLTAIVVLWIIVTGILVMRGDVGARTGITRLISVSLVVGILMSTTLYNEYITDFFTQGIPNWIASSFEGVSGIAPSAQQFDTLWMKSTAVFGEVGQGLQWYNVIYNIELAILEIAVAIPIGVMFLIFEVAKIMVDVVVSIGPFLLLGYLFSATKGIADRFIGKLISLTILILLVDIVLSIIINGYTTYIADTMAIVTTNTNRAVDMAVIIQMFIFFAIGALVATFLPGLAAYFGGGVSVSPLAMAMAVRSVASLRRAPSGGGQK
jgi:type IV secretion system protein VirB6